MFSELDRAMMARALALAEQGLFTTTPNPRVGCVVAKDGRIVGEGWHEKAGGPHAEVAALAKAGGAAEGATVYVSLEPCNHYGRTPPCAGALINAKVARVVAALRDPNPHASGGGTALATAGIRFEAGLMEEAAQELNIGCISRVTRGRPWVRLKAAATLDGRTALADGSSRWITGEAARSDNMRWRARSSAILTGIGTVLADDPHLTVRGGKGGRSAVSPETLAHSSEAAANGHSDPLFTPLRVVLDSRLRIPATARVLDDAAPTLVFCSPDVIAAHRELPASKLMSCPNHATGLGLAVVLAELAQRGVNELQVEAGPVLSGAFVHAGLVDELLLYFNPSMIGDTGLAMLQLPPLEALGERARFRVVDQRSVGTDLRLLLRPAGN